MPNGISTGNTVLYLQTKPVFMFDSIATEITLGIILILLFISTSGLRLLNDSDTFKTGVRSSHCIPALRTGSLNRQAGSPVSPGILKRACLELPFVYLYNAVLLLLANSVAADSFSQAPVAPSQQPCTIFPSESKWDYTVREFQARVGMPQHNDSGRVWVKGSQTFCWYKVLAAGATTEPVLLLPPNYTDVANVLPGDATVLFGMSNASFDTASMIAVKTVSGQTFWLNDGTFSLLFYGCLEPFEINKKTGVSQLNSGKFGANYQMRKLFNLVCSHQAVEFKKQPRCEDSTYKYELGETLVQPLLSPVKLIIGTGDQVYVDAGYGNQEKLSSISTWTIEKQPRHLVDTICYGDHINRMYRHFGSFGLLNGAFQTVPSTAVWDDHEIRDGWGSQGDEYVNGTLNNELRPYYLLSRAGYLDHHASMGFLAPAAVRTLRNNNENLHQEFVAGGIRVFAFDLRSNRDITRKQVIDRTQLEAFARWIDRSRQDEEVVIVSSIPLFLGYNPFKINLAKILSSEGRDDIADGWDSEFNCEQRNEIIRLIVKNRIEKNIRPFVVSGDVHAGGILELWYNETHNDKLSPEQSRKQRKVLCYELIATGLNHETLNKEKFGLFAKFFSKQKKTAQKQWRNEELLDSLAVHDGLYTVSTIARINGGSLNFGSLEFADTVTSIHLFLKSTVGDYIEQFTVKAEWHKNDSDDWKYMKIKTNNRRRFKYEAALSQERKIIDPNKFR